MPQRALRLIRSDDLRESLPGRNVDSMGTTYRAEVISLDGTPTIRLSLGRYCLGYFPTVEAMAAKGNYGRALDLSLVEIVS